MPSHRLAEKKHTVSDSQTDSRISTTADETRVDGGEESCRHGEPRRHAGRRRQLLGGQPQAGQRFPQVVMRLNLAPEDSSSAWISASQGHAGLSTTAQTVLRSRPPEALWQVRQQPALARRLHCEKPGERRCVAKLAAAASHTGMFSRRRGAASGLPIDREI